MISFEQKIRQIMGNPPPELQVNAPLRVAVEQMETHRSSCLLIKEGSAAVGIITERDVVKAFGQGNAPTDPVSEIMTRGLISVHETEDVHSAFHKMMTNNIRHLAVVDRHEQVIGILSEADFRKYRSLEDFDAAITVAKAMSQAYLRANMNDTVFETARQLQSLKLTCAIVIDEENKPHGIVTERDMVKLFKNQAGATRLSDIMTTPVTSVFETVKLEAAVQLMRNCNIRRLVVVNTTGEMIGILNEHDVLRHMETDYVHMLQQLIIKQAQELNENIFIAAINNMQDKILVKDTESRYIACNDNFAHDFNLTPKDIIGKSDADLFTAEQAAAFRREDAQILATGQPFASEMRTKTDEKETWVNINRAPMLDAQGKLTGIVISFQDITERKQAEIALQRRSWALKALSDSNKAIVFARTENAMLKGVCEAVVNAGIYSLAWIGWAEQDAAKSVRVAAAAGKAIKFLDEVTITWDDSPSGNGPTGTAIRQARTIVNNHALSNPAFAIWKDKAARHDLHASLAVPILIEGNVVAGLMIYASDCNAFGQEEVMLFEDLARTLGHGLGSLILQRNFDRSLIEKSLQAQKLDAALEGALMAVASTLEQRDPYTAGHEKLVAELAVKIGKEMQLDSETLRGLHLAGIVHDLGKIQVPAEILTKSSRLSPTEFALVKVHPEVGYEILKNIEFPWPIAEIIRQHHESIDGSGYPRGLKGDEILLEAKILTVADIVESMSSDRPYRPALGQMKAIEEIKRLSGSKLDPEVVAACVAVLEHED